MSTAGDLVRIGRRIVELGLTRGSSGNISVRDADSITITPSGSDLGSLDTRALSVVDQDGCRRFGARPSKELPFHQAFYRRDQDCRAVVHVHSPAALAVSCLTPWRDFSAVPPITPYFVLRVGQTPLVPYADPGDEQQARHIEQLEHRFRAVLLQNHGIVAGGQDLDEALDIVVELEQTCDVLLRLGGQTPHLLGEEAVQRLSSRYGSPWTRAR